MLQDDLDKALARLCEEAKREGARERELEIRKELMDELEKIPPGRLAHDPEVVHALKAVRDAVERICPAGMPVWRDQTCSFTGRVPVKSAEGGRTAACPECGRVWSIHHGSRIEHFGILRHRRPLATAEVPS